jgi:hypothetical protein
VSAAVAGAGTLLDAWMPAWDEVERHSTVVRAPAERVYATARKLDVGRSPVIRSLLALRSLPSLLSRRRESGRGEPRGGGSGMSLDRLVASGFVVLDERPSEELLLGLVGRFWTADGGCVRVTPDEFRAFDRPGYARAAWNFSLAPEPGGVRLATETRVLCTDDEARRSFRRYWRFIGPFSGLIRREMLRALRLAAESEDAG